jgi:hypothetical protein
MLPTPQASLHPAAQDGGVASPSNPPPLRDDADPGPSTVEPPKDREMQVTASSVSNHPPGRLATIREIGEKSHLETWDRAPGTPRERNGRV